MLDKAFEYKEWADLRTLATIDRIDPLNRPGTLKFVTQQLNHMVIVEEMFKARLLDDHAPHEATYSVTVPELSELRSRIEVSHKWYADFIYDLGESDIKRRISFVFSDGKHGCMTVSEILFHVLNHGTYHRGSIAHALDLADLKHPADGYAIFIHDKEPERREHHES